MLCLLLLLTGCGNFIDWPALDLGDCAAVSAIPAGPVPWREVERLWLTDRASLLDCSARYNALRAIAPAPT